VHGVVAVLCSQVAASSALWSLISPPLNFINGHVDNVLRCQATVNNNWTTQNEIPPHAHTTPSQQW